MYPRRGATKKKEHKDQYKEELIWRLSLRGKEGGGKGNCSVTLSRPQSVTVRRVSVRWKRKISRRWGKRHSSRGEGSADLLEAIAMNNL